MAARKHLAATAVALGLSVSVSLAGSCDDYAEEMALAEAVRAAKLAQSAIPPPTPATSPPELSQVAASVDAEQAPMQTTERAQTIARQ